MPIIFRLSEAKQFHVARLIDISQGKHPRRRRTAV